MQVKEFFAETGSIKSLTIIPTTSSFSITSSYALTSAGTVTNATSASFATTSSYAVLAQNLLGSTLSASYALTASYAQNSTGNVNFSSGSYTGSFTGSLQGSSSYSTVAQNVLGSITSASYALTASYAQNSTGGGVNFSSGSYTGSFTGSLLGTSTPNQMTSASIASLTWFQQGSATHIIGINDGTSVFTLPALGTNQIASTDHTLSLPGSDWNFRGYIWPATTDAAGFAGGLTIRENSTGKMVTLFVVRSGGAPTYGIQIWRWSAYNTFDTTIATIDFSNYQNLLRPVTLQISRVGSNIIYSYNLGLGGSTITLASEGVTTSFTTQPDHVGIGANAAGAIASTFNIGWLDYTF